jgi:hypothetical protein
MAPPLYFCRESICDRRDLDILDGNLSVGPPFEAQPRLIWLEAALSRAGLATE